MSTATATPPVFEAWPKTPRWNRHIVVTEKVDGTNACIVVGEDGSLFTQSRRRIITPESDNAGFARWAHENHDALVARFGPGRHFGEWYGHGIQRGYGFTDGVKRFMPFNSGRWTAESLDAAGLLIVGVRPPTVLYDGPMSQEAIDATVERLRAEGSVQVPGQAAEGVIVFHSSSRSMFKILCENDETPKSVSA